MYCWEHMPYPSDTQGGWVEPVPTVPMNFVGIAWLGMGSATDKSHVLQWTSD